MTRRLIVVLGDQLDDANAAVEAGDPKKDRIVMIETAGEATHVWSHKHRIAVFVAAMRHFKAALERTGWSIDYTSLSAGCPSLASGLAEAITRAAPERVDVVQPGEWRVLESLQDVCTEAGLDLVVHEDTHFLCDLATFDSHADNRKTLRMEYFYREMRKRYDVLMSGDKPVNGRWNYDTDNRGAFGKSGPGKLPLPPSFRPDQITRSALTDVDTYFPSHPGSLENFDWPVTKAAAERALDVFIEERLPEFGRYQDAMWAGEPYLFHSLIAAALNLKLLNPRDVIERAEKAWRDGNAPIAAVEGFIRQVLGWREFIRGVYWRFMPEYAAHNHYKHENALPDWFWTGDVDMACLGETISDTLRNAYAHHIQRLMIVCNFCVLAGIDPKEVSDWFLAVYVDAVEWVELPNVIGMGLHADGGIVGSKPYVSSGAYIKRMSNYCGTCRYDPKKRTGDDACPFTVFYWDFLNRNKNELGSNPRMRTILKNLDRWGPSEIRAIGDAATNARRHLDLA